MAHFHRGDREPRQGGGSIIITTNIAFKDWPRIFAGDATMTSVLLDRLLHHAQPVFIAGDSYRSANKNSIRSRPLNNLPVRAHTDQLAFCAIDTGRGGLRQRTRLVVARVFCWSLNDCKSTSSWAEAPKR